MRDEKYVIMHVDDSLTARELVMDSLEACGYEARSAEDARDLEHILTADPFLRSAIDMFILDFEMPDMTGAQVGAIVEMMYDELVAVPFVIYSGRSKEYVEGMSEEVASMSPGFKENYRGYISKGPDSEDVLMDKVEKVLDSLDH